jgi:hypothetical protein
MFTTTSIGQVIRSLGRFQALDQGFHGLLLVIQGGDGNVGISGNANPY